MHRMTLACLAGAAYCIASAVASGNAAWLFGVLILAAWDGLWQRYVVRQGRRRGQQ